MIRSNGDIYILFHLYHIPILVFMDIDGEPVGTLVRCYKHFVKAQIGGVGGNVFNLVQLLKTSPLH
jgi:hypothetical protein